MKNSKTGKSSHRHSHNRTIQRASISEKKQEQISKFRNLFTPQNGKKLKTNRFMYHTCFLIVLLFAGLIAYLVKFDVMDSQAIMTNPYNKRYTSMAEQTKRGKILSANDKILAYSDSNEAGDEIRRYPYENMFAHIIGYASYGKAGLESVCNLDLLTSHENLMKQISNGVSSKKNTGDTVVTTLDTRLQKAAYEALDDYRGAVIAIEPKTGKIRAMVSKPDFDPNELDEIWDKINSDSSESFLLNRATQGLYPPGSTYKILTALEYMEENPDTYQNFTYDCDGQTIKNSVKIRCYEGEEHGEVDLEKAFSKSCNTAFVTLGSKLNIKQFAKLNNTCLFNQKISFDIPVKKSRFELTARSKKSEIPQTVIGQGNTLVTPFHNALIMSGMANNGVLMKPYVIDHIESEDGIMVKQSKPEEYRTLTDAKHARKIKKMLRSVVTDGTGRSLDTDLYSAGGKTGTAENEGEDPHSWFVGYASGDDAVDGEPDLAVCVIVESSGAGSEYAVPVAKRVFNSYYNNEMKKYYNEKESSNNETTTVEE
ncbi:MAG: penicillin-binding protein 2 [Eubacterium sp.]|nr:penicillin-binding protein 2 [Eubacterium sp.]MDY5497473.1 penicillin-binding transpeptidase domain-containing protein [Anaerobutyricum sp.]